MSTINTANCTECKYCTVEEKDKAHIYVNCSLKEKRYFWGQTIPCDDKEKKKDG